MFGEVRREVEVEQGDPWEDSSLGILGKLPWWFDTEYFRGREDDTELEGYF